MELYATKLSIYEVGLSSTPNIFTDQHNRRIECLWVCLNAIKSWVNVFLSITPAQYVGFSALIYSNMIHCLVDMYRLSNFEHAAWDRTLFREHLDVAWFFAESEKNFARVKDEAGLDIGGSQDVDSFSSMASKIGMVKGSWDATNGSSITSINTPSNDEMELHDIAMEFSEDDWLRDLFRPWNE